MEEIKEIQSADSTSGEEINPAAAAQETEEKNPDERFEELIKGEYKEQFRGRVQEIISARFRKEKQAEKELAATEAAKREQEKARFIYDSLKKEAEELKGLYPEFSLEAEMKNGLFRGLLSSPEVDMRSAYEVCHRDEIFSSAMASAARMAREKTMEGLINSGVRPADTVGASTNAGVDVKALTKRQREELLKRASRGERISFK